MRLKDCWFLYKKAILIFLTLPPNPAGCDHPGSAVSFTPKQTTRIMKMKSLMAGLIIMSVAAIAQEKKLTITHVNKGEEPAAVMDALKKDFPGFIVDDLSFLPGKLYGDEWNIQMSGDGDMESTYYNVRVKEGNRSFTGVYDKNGKLLSSKQMVDYAMLPKPVQDATRQYADWHVDHAHEYIKYNAKKSSDVYRVKIQKGGQHKFLFIDPTGKIQNTRFTLF